MIWASFSHNSVFNNPMARSPFLFKAEKAYKNVTEMHDAIRNSEPRAYPICCRTDCDYSRN